MPATAPITFWHWAGFIVVVLVFLAADLGLIHRSNRPIPPKTALFWSAIWFLSAMLFARILAVWRGPGESLEFVTGYFVEFSLSMDNIAVIALIFAWFAVPGRYQHRVLFWGILGALVTRGIIIVLGVALIRSFHWMFFLLGAFLIFTGIRWALARESAVHPDKNPLVRLARKILPLSDNFDADKFRTTVGDRRVWTPLVLVLLTIETVDLIFAVDSVPAVFAVTQKPFIVFTSNVFAILGLRSLYPGVARAIECFRYLKTGLAAVLVFVGAKMLAADWVTVSTALSLVIVAGILALSIVLSIFTRSWQKKA
jgi:tellurite resistance protein TerC